MIQDGQLLNYIRGVWQRSRANDYLGVRNPATAQTIVRVPLTPRDEVNEAVLAAQSAFADWRRIRLLSVYSTSSNSRNCSTIASTRSRLDS